MINIKQDKGITLVALVITIIIILLLSVIVIKQIIGDNGIINKANKSKILTEVGEIRDNVRMLAVKEGNITGKLDDINLNIEQNLLNRYNDILYIKDGEVFLSYFADYPQTQEYQANKELIENLKGELKVSKDSLKEKNVIKNPHFDDGFSGYSKKTNSVSKMEILNEDGNNFAHLEFEKGSNTTYISLNNIEVAENYNEEIYLCVKYRNNYVENEEGFAINNGLIIFGRTWGGFDSNLLTKQKFIDAYNKGWQSVSFIKKITPEYGRLGLRLILGGSETNLSYWNYKIDFDDIYVINLTQIFGAGNEPTKEEMDKIFY